MADRSLIERTGVSPLAFATVMQMIAPDDPAMPGMVAASSGRVYRSTYKKWARWTTENEVDPLAVEYSTVAAFIAEQDVTRTTKQRQLSALRKFAEVLAVLDYDNPARRAAADGLRMLKVRHSGETRVGERRGRALTPAEADRLLRVWSKDRTARGKRNDALITLALFTGLRRAELSALVWQDIDAERGIVHVRHGKGDEPRDVAIFGELALSVLKVWQWAQPPDWRFVFVKLRKGHGRNFIADKPLSTTGIYNVVRETGRLAGIEGLTPHDLRRTLITELLATGTPLASVQAQVGHLHGTTTLVYAQAVDAALRRAEARLRYGYRGG